MSSSIPFMSPRDMISFKASNRLFFGSRCPLMGKIPVNRPSPPYALKQFTICHSRTYNLSHRRITKRLNVENWRKTIVTERLWLIAKGFRKYKLIYV